MFVYFGSPLIQNNTIQNNSQTGCVGGIGGAGIDVTASGTETLQIIGNRILQNTAANESGGGIHMFEPGAFVLETM